jgi:hypothetical protein
MIGRSDDERRRHARLVRPVGAATLAAGAGPALAVEVKDVGLGGCFVLIDPPPRLHDPVVVGFGGFVLDGRVVRVQRGGRDKGQPVRPGVAVAFHGVDEATLTALQGFLAG